jgi:AcrR family transcriptional regulator
MPERRVNTRNRNVAVTAPDAPLRNQTDRSTWVRAATHALAEHGLDGVKVETLARRLGLTKGSFYWHFRDRRELLDAMLDTWHDGRLDDIRSLTRCTPGEEMTQLHHVIDTYSVARNQRGIRVELAVRDWARHDQRARAVVDAVDAVRLDCATALFVGAGITPDEARNRSLLLYAYVFGLGMMDGERESRSPPAARAFIAHLITGG